ncbi:hypothetical protein DSM112329_01090 [Paraconexibacter sp. AEG42_29]|uniref:Uncharacterized protein n=1 Tax=Paraconexibacter sp. AEG42_29 TaxID=2997339 RepID=A0AAU7ARP1_9ACTN
MSRTPESPNPQPADSCGTGICGADVPPLIGRTLTGTGLTLDQAARVLLEDGTSPPALTPIQRRLVEEHAAHLDAA